MGIRNKKILIVGCHMMLSSVATALSKLDKDEYMIIGEHDNKVFERKSKEVFKISALEPMDEQVSVKPIVSHPFEKFIGKKVGKGKRGRNF
jgi:hypothetical protein